MRGAWRSAFLVAAPARRRPARREGEEQQQQQDEELLWYEQHICVAEAPLDRIVSDSRRKALRHWSSSHGQKVGCHKSIRVAFATPVVPMYPVAQ